MLIQPFGLIRAAFLLRPVTTDTIRLSQSALGNPEVGIFRVNTLSTIENTNTRSAAILPFDKPLICHLGEEIGRWVFRQAHIVRHKVQVPLAILPQPRPTAGQSENQNGGEEDTEAEI